MKKVQLHYITLIVCAIFTVGLISAKGFVEPGLNQLSETEKAEGFILIFDGKTPTGWRGYNRDAFPAAGWSVENGVLFCKGNSGEGRRLGGDIIFDQKFKDFHLKLEWKISEEGNSGIFYLASELRGKPIWHTGPEMQILDDDRHIDATRGVNGNRKSGSLYDMIPANPHNVKPVGEWNAVEIIVSNGLVSHWMNGEKVVEFQINSPEWDRLVNKSKFHDLESFGEYEAGYIGLQDHGDDVWFRNIRIREL
jgi:hypothetical protein